MKRREFFNSLFLSGMALGCGRSVLAQTRKLPDISVVQGDSPSVITRKAIDLIGGMKKFVSKGDVVTIKPNIAFDRKPKFAGCTNPEVVGALVELCLDSGAKEVRILDNPVHPAAATYASSGIAEAVEKAGGKVLYPDFDRTTSVKIDGEQIKSASIFTDLIESDKLINVPILKTHPFTKLTMGMKNWLGAVASNRQNYHDRIHDNIVDLAGYFKPALTVLDAYRVMVRNGPDGGSVSDVSLQKKVIAGVDFVAVDAVGAFMCNYKPKDLNFIKKANKRGFGEMDIQKLKVDMRASR